VTHYRSCNFCGSVSFRVFRCLDTPFPSKIYGDSELTHASVGQYLKLQYLECRRCGLVCINPLTTFGDINRCTYDREHNLLGWSGLDYRAYEETKRRSIAVLEREFEFEEFRRAGRLLEVRCGPGVAVQWLRENKRWDAWGIDPDRRAVRLGRERYGLNIAGGLLPDVRAAEESFDLLLMDSLQRSFDPLGELLDAFRFLRKGGALVIFVPNCDGLSTRFLNGNVFWGNWFFYRPRVLAQILWRMGCEMRKLSAVQCEINPDLAARGIELDPFRRGLTVNLQGDAAIKAGLESGECFADFFSLMAVKPLDADVAADGEAALRALAGYSLMERPSVRILPPFDSWDAAHLVPDIRIDTERTPSTAGELVSGRRFGQTFVCRNDRLAKINILVATYRKVIPRGTLDIHLRTGVNQGSDIACVSIPAETISDNSYVTLEFSPIGCSAGKTYYFYLETHDIPPGYAFTVWRSNTDIYPQGSFYLDGQPLPQAISFETFFRQ
jgi:SAM-dependent methyltransferase